MAAATATVMGLLFIAVQLSTEKLENDETRPYRALAFSTFTNLMVVFLLPVCFLMPALNNQNRALIAFIAAGFGLWRIFRNWLPLIRNPYLGRRERTFQTIWHIIGPLLAYFYLLFIGFRILSNNPQDPNFQIAITLVFLFSTGIRNSWNLVMEMTFDRKK